MAEAKGRAGRRARYWTYPLVGVVLALGAAGGLIAWRITWQFPAWWAPPDPAQAQALAERVEYRVVEEAHRIRPEGEAWRIRITEQQINAWLSSRLLQWVAHAHDLEWPQRLGVPQVRVGEGFISLGLAVEEKRGLRFVACRAEPQVLNGRLALTTQRVWLGRLPIPGAPLRVLASRIDGAAPDRFTADPKVEAALRLLGGALQLDPALRLPDGRRLRLLSVHCRQGAVILQLSTTAASP